MTRPASDPDLEALGRDVLAASLLRGDFLLSSGKRSPYYLDKYLFETRPEILGRLAAAMAARLPAGVDRIVGTELGAVALATALSLETGLPFVIARKGTKEYSTAKTIEGAYQPGERVVVVEDVITTGAQAIKAAERMREAGVEVLGILAVIDREEGGREGIEAAGLRLDALFTRTGLGI
jgi:orotate phosphoribosyltransferase